MCKRQRILSPGVKTVPRSQLEEFFPAFLGNKHQGIDIPRYARATEKRSCNTANNYTGDMRGFQPSNEVA